MEMKVVEWLSSVKEVVSIIITNEMGYMIFAFVGVILLMIIDIFTGFSQAKINKKLTSHKMSNGLLKKFNILTIILVLMFICLLLPKDIGYITLGFIFIYEYVNELVSIGENLLKMNIQSNFMKPILNILNRYLNNYEKSGKK